jgi:hypothetical protein
LGSDIWARVEAMVTMAPRAARSDRSAARAKRKVARQVGVQDLAPLAQGELAQRLAHHDARVGNERIEAVELLSDRLDRASGGLLVGDIAFNEDDVASISVVAALQPGLRQVDRADMPSAIQQVVRDCTADAARGPGDDCDRLLGTRHGSGLGIDRKIVSCSPFRP